MDKKLKWHDEIEGVICAVIMALMLAILFYQVVARYAFRMSSAQVDELSRYMLVWLAYISTCYAITHNQHIKVDMLLYVWPKGWRRAINLLGVVVFFAYCLIITYYSAAWLMGLHRSGAITLGLKAPMALICSIIPISHFIMSMRLIQLFVKTLKAPRSAAGRDETAIEQVIREHSGKEGNIT